MSTAICYYSFRNCFCLIRLRIPLYPDIRLNMPLRFNNKIKNQINVFEMSEFEFSNTIGIPSWEYNLGALAIFTTLCMLSYQTRKLSMLSLPLVFRLFNQADLGSIFFPAWPQFYLDWTGIVCASWLFRTGQSVPFGYFLKV